MTSLFNNSISSALMKVTIMNYKNADVVKFNRSDILKCAWKRVKEQGYSLSKALECAWYDAKYLLKKILDRISEIEKNVAKSKAVDFSDYEKSESHAEYMREFYNSNCYKGD